jgi:leucyl/phenylalanyl-tRNA---protein transferase
MKVTLLDDSNEFPPVSSADKSGIVAVGGDLSAARLLSAYENGIFPWFNPGEMILWWSPEERGIIPLDGLKVHKSMRNEINRMRYTVTYDTCFKDVITQCSNSFRGENTQPGTWIGQNMINAYLELHKLGAAHSVEVWKGAELVGGLYGVSIGRMFFGESMFSKATNASKIGLFNLVEKLKSWGFGPIDCQMMNPHLESLGAIPISRSEFQNILDKHLRSGKTLLGTWTE